jgi:hypothetical protein
LRTRVFDSERYIGGRGCTRVARFARDAGAPASCGTGPLVPVDLRCTDQILCICSRKCRCVQYVDLDHLRIFNRGWMAEIY